MLKQLQRFILGKPLATHEAPHQTIGKTVALAVFASDALSSVAYATEEILIVLAASGAAFFGLSLPIAIAIVALLIVLTASYRQTIFAYPNGGGAYIVARDNLGELAAQTAGASLLTDYVLTVSVSVASGIAQINSAFPSLLPWRVPIAVATIAIMTVVNLRGVKESGRIFAIPTYFFIIMMFGMLCTGFYKVFHGTLSTVVGANNIAPIIQPLTLFLLLRAFSSGCTALTGVEAISNGVTAFREPKSRNAATTMTWMSAFLGIMFLGITFLAHQIHAVPMENETIISQLARTIYGHGILKLLTLGATTVILIMAANTSFADFPRLAALHAGDGFLPRHLIQRGSRLVFSEGILLLSGLAMALVVIFNANVSHLIPLYAIGVFLSFTLSQAGMVIRWKKIGKLKPGETRETKGSVLRHDPHWRFKQILSGLGALLTGVVMLVFAITKFVFGAWIVVILIPLMTAFFFRIHRHYKLVAKQLSLSNPIPKLPKEKAIIILVSGVHQGTLKAVEFVKLLNPIRVRAMHVGVIPDEVEKIKTRWKQWVPDIELDIVESPYRELIDPMIAYIERVAREWSDDTIVIAIPESISTKPWHHWLHGRTAHYIREILEHREDVLIIDVPYRLHDYP